MRRSETLDAKLVAATLDAWTDRTGILPLSAIVERFNTDYATEFGLMSNRAVGSIVRSHFQVRPRKSNGVYVIPPAERMKIENLAYRLGVTHDAAVGESAI